MAKSKESSISRSSLSLLKAPVAFSRACLNCSFTRKTFLSADSCKPVSCNTVVSSARVNASAQVICCLCCCLPVFFPDSCLVNLRQHNFFKSFLLIIDPTRNSDIVDFTSLQDRQFFCTFPLALASSCFRLRSLL